MRRIKVSRVLAALCLVVALVALGVQYQTSREPAEASKMLTAAPSVSAKPEMLLSPSKWDTGIGISNLGSAPANVVVTFYPKDGTSCPGMTPPFTWIPPASPIPVGGSISYGPAAFPVCDGFVGSAVVSSDQPVQAIVNEQTTGPSVSDSYTSFDPADGGTTSNAAIIMKNYYGSNTILSVQNVDSATSAQYTIKYYNAAGVNYYTTPVQTIAAGVMKSYNNATDPNIASGIGSAVVNSTNGVKLVTLIQETSDASGGSAGSLYVVKGETSGDTTLYAPSLLKAYYGYESALQVQNIGNVATQVNVQYSDGVSASAIVQPGQGKTFLNFLEAHTNGTTYSAKITSVGTGGNPAQPLIGVVNQSNSSTGRASAYNLIRASKTTGTAFATAIYNRYYGYSTALVVQNVNAAAVNVTVQYGPSGAFPGTTRVVTVPANGFLNLYNFLPKDGLPGSSPGVTVVTAGADLPAGYNGNATVTVPAGSKVAAIVSQEIVNGTAPNPGPGDWKRSYGTLNK